MTPTSRSIAEHRKGVLLMIGATLCWASAGVLVRNMSIKDGWEITFWRSIFMMLFIGGYVLYKRRVDASPRPLRIDRASLLSGCLWALMYVCFNLALARTSVANTLVLCSISPFFAALAGHFFLGEQVATRTWIATIVAFLGIAVMFAGSLGGGAWVGNLLAIMIPIAFAANVVLLRQVHACGDMTITLLVSGVVSVLVTLPAALPFEAGAKDFVLLAIMGAAQLGLGCLLMLFATPRLAAAEIGLLAILETIFGTFSTWAFIGEQPAVATLIGGTIVIAALAANEFVAMRKQTLSPIERETLKSVSGH